MEVKGYWEKLTGKKLFQYVRKFKNAGERKIARTYAEQRSRDVSCDVVLSAFDRILTIADEGEMAERIRGGRGPRPSRASGVPAKAAGALLAAAVVSSQTSMAAGSAYWFVASTAIAVLLVLAGDAPYRMG